MSPSAFIVRRVKVDGAWVSSRTARPTNREDRRYVVRYRLHGRELHAGTFTTEATAEARRRWIELQIAEGRGYDIPALLAEPERGATVAEAMQAALDAMPKPSEAQRKRFRNADKQLGRLGPMPVADVRRGDVQKWVNVLAEKYAAATVSQYLVPVRQAFDHAEIVPNPARDPRLRLPLPDDDDEFEPPTLAEFESMVAAARKDVRDVLVVLEGTGMRIKEALALTWGDVDLAGRRLRVARGRTKGRKPTQMLLTSAREGARFRYFADSPNIKSTSRA